ncbi:UAP56-interacting factor isoform X2 [Misgurnus anguillicaudatus]|uniref:UAP56-interacting factor isoform X2 n=1 Tax=Misgurnus anguillicaudatus TaxID=75329 RepID=UPI0024349722|nr:UAP56-interacting factor-like isoform X2 [Misgurnus anguillicaudatus]
MSRSSFQSVGSTEELDKVDMSLDDIIRLNKKQKQIQTQKTNHRTPARGHFSQGKTSGARAGVPSKRGGVTNKRFGWSRKFPPTVARRRGQGVITGLAARKNAVLLKGISPLNRPAQIRPAQNRPMLNRQVANNSALNQKSQPFVQRRDPQRRHMQIQRRPHRQMDSQKHQGSVSHRPFRLPRKWNVPSAPQTQRETRQATFLFRRGLKVNAQVQETRSTSPTQRTHSWRTSTNNSGILTVSIDNPAARTQPEHAQSWSLHPSTSTRLSPQSKDDAERRPPKGVPLQFDINSVGKQTGITLNERFRILNDQRVAATHQTSKRGRFVTVA